MIASCCNSNIRLRGTRRLSRQAAGQVLIIALLPIKSLKANTCVEFTIVQLIIWKIKKSKAILALLEVKKRVNNFYRIITPQAI